MKQKIVLSIFFAVLLILVIMGLQTVYDMKTAKPHASNGIVIGINGNMPLDPEYKSFVEQKMKTAKFIGSSIIVLTVLGLIYYNTRKR